jgi:hypothetical protein
MASNANQFLLPPFDVISRTREYTLLGKKFKIVTWLGYGENLRIGGNFNLSPLVGCGKPCTHIHFISSSEKTQYRFIAPFLTYEEKHNLLISYKLTKV